MTMGQRFGSKVQRGSGAGCWIWTAHTNQYGYGVFWVNRECGDMLAHRAAWLIYKGQHPGSADVCHTCDNPKCVNPDHLFLGSAADNMRDCAAKGRIPRGSSRPNAKLDENDVRNIRDVYRGGGISKAALARYFQVDASLISRVVGGSRWEHVN